jgi:magnesium chelatase family protein
MCRLVHVSDRIDPHVAVPAVPFQELSADGTSSASKHQQVTRAREAQHQRFRAEGGG